MQASKLLVFNNGIKHYGASKKIPKNNSILVIMFCVFQKDISQT
jgi:hypothetical protein